MRLRVNLPRLPTDSMKHAKNFKRLTGLSGMICTVKNKDVSYKVEGILEKNSEVSAFHIPCMDTLVHHKLTNSDVLFMILLPLRLEDKTVSQVVSYF
jgi:hypothetical protein